MPVGKGKTGGQKKCSRKKSEERVEGLPDVIHSRKGIMFHRDDRELTTPAFQFPAAFLTTFTARDWHQMPCRVCNIACNG